MWFQSESILCPRCFKYMQQVGAIVPNRPIVATLTLNMLSWLPRIFISHSTSEVEKIPPSINWFPNRRCNYECSFCFHTTKNTFILPLGKAQFGLRMLAVAGMRKLNISGGEPFLNPRYIGEVFKFCKEQLNLESTSVVCNGSKVTEGWMKQYGQYLDVMAISCDSFDPETNSKHGRGDPVGGRHINNVKDVVDLCRHYGIRVKINSVITMRVNHLRGDIFALKVPDRNNWEEDMNEGIAELGPFRWKVFQVLLLDGENTGAENGSIRDARHLTITKVQFQSFIERHKSLSCMVPEDNETMRDSYLNLDEEMRFLNCRDGDKKPGRSVLEVGPIEALEDAGFDERAFDNRGGVYDWGRQVAPHDFDW